MEEKIPHPHEGMDYLMPGEEDDYEDEVNEEVTESEGLSRDDIAEIMATTAKLKQMKDEVSKKYSYYKNEDYSRSSLEAWQQQQHDLDNYLRGSIRGNSNRYSNSGSNA